MLLRIGGRDTKMQKLVEHPSVTHAEVYDAAMRDGTMSTRVLVRTSLELDPDSGGFDRPSYEALMSAIQDFMDRRPDITAADIEGG